MISEYDKWFWKQCDELNKDTNLAYTLAKDAWEFQQIHIDELTQTLIKEQEEVLKYKPSYLNLIAENERLKMQMNCFHAWVGKSEDQHCSKCGYK